ncbi:hypothetical protein [Methylobacterium gossipiicola]|uniref:Uncharacterized protein n=1 Tax=Methylobacterium gossipiicola TaxID=582675 RepID=A0A1I2TJF9_9HYPH|nr:hypothetical protein [Methylobacterium gossipiicola]SFG65055.1 hypothetical protein SAMN05192565_107155 [Methylobacterium gossipiicola]
MKHLFLVLALCALLPTAALSRAAMETNQLVDDNGIPFGTATNPIYTLGGGSGGGPTGSVTAAGTNGTSAQAVQGITGGVPQNVQLPSGATTTTGALQPPTAASGKIVDTSVTLTSNTSTVLVAARATPGDRLAVEIQCDGTAVVGIDMKGGTLTSATAAPRVIPSGSYPLYTPPVATQTAITAYTGTAQTCRVTEYLR